MKIDDYFRDEFKTKDMQFKGKVYAKMNGRYLECTETIEDLEKKISDLEANVPNDKASLVAFMRYYKNNVPIGTQKSSIEIVNDYLGK